MSKLRIITLLIIALSFLSCGTNFYSFLVVTKDSSEVMVLEEARNDLDDKNYTDAINRLEELDEDSNEKYLLLASAHIGASGLDLWTLIRGVIEDDSRTSDSGIDSVFNAATQGLFGTGEERIAKRDGMRNAIHSLMAAPDTQDSRISNLGCFLAGLWSFPTIEVASSVVTNLQNVLTELNSSIMNTGDCGSTEELTSDVSDVSVVAEDIQLISQMIEGCTLFSTENASGQLNSLERSLNKFILNADKGCMPSACTGNALVCAALEASCVQDSFSLDAIAGDEKVSTCEILYGCADSSLCF